MVHRAIAWRFLCHVLLLFRNDIEFKAKPGAIRNISKFSWKLPVLSLGRVREREVKSEREKALPSGRTDERREGGREDG